MTLRDLLLVSGCAICCAACAVAAEYGSLRWHYPGPGLNEDDAPSGVSAADLLRARIQVGEVLAARGARRLSLEDALAASDNEEKPAGDRAELLRPGDKVYVGDTLTTDKNGMVEMFLGINARVLLGGHSRLRAVDMRAERSDERTATKRYMLLADGDFRARVRENVYTPSPLIVRAGSTVMEIGRPGLYEPGGVDARVSAEEKGGAGLVVLNGSVALAHAADETTHVTAKAGTRLAVPARPEGELVPERDDEAVARARADMPFRETTVDPGGDGGDVADLLEGP